MERLRSLSSLSSLSSKISDCEAYYDVFEDNLYNFENLEQIFDIYNDFDPRKYFSRSRHNYPDKCYRIDENNKHSKNHQPHQSSYTSLFSTTSNWNEPKQEQNKNLESGYYSEESISEEENNQQTELLQPIIIMSAHSSIVYGALTRQLQNAWLHNSNHKTKAMSVTGQTPPDSPDVIPIRSHPSTYQRRLVTEIQAKFHCVDLYPTESQVFEMIQFASRCSRRRTLHSLQGISPESSSNEQTEQLETGLTFGEFCFFASILINSTSNRTQPRPLVSNHAFNLRLDHVQSTTAHYNRNSGHHSYPHLHHSHGHHRPSLVDHGNRGSKFDIFLGGSCNPTRWRLDLVMPELKKNCITYYNPQVDHWGPELIELESYAKQNSEVLFFVIDNQTRAIASMIEVAFIAASRRKLILVIIDLQQWSEQTRVCDDHISKEEYEELRIGRQYLRDIVERQEIPIFNDISKALRSAIQVLHEKVWPQDLTASDDVIPVKNGHVSLGDKIIHIYHVYDQSKNSQTKEFTFAEFPFAYLMLTRRDVSSGLLEQMARCHCLRKSLSKKPEDLTTLPPLDKITIDFNDFCIIISELNIAFAKTNSNEINDHERISEASETTETGQGSFNGSETDSDNCQKSNRYIKRKKKKLNRKVSTKSNDTTTANQLSSRFFDKLSNVVNSFKSLLIDSDIISEHQTNQEISNRRSKKKQKHENSTNNKRVMSNTRRSKNGDNYDDIIDQKISNIHMKTMLDPMGYPLQINYSQSPDYLMRSSQSLNQLNDYHYQLNAPYHCHLYRNSISPFRKSSSPRNHIASSHWLDQMTRDNNPRRRSYYHSSFVTQHQSPQPNMISSSSQSSITSLLYENVYDLYLGGCLDRALMQETIIPLLKKHSIRFCLPKFEKLSKHERMIPLEAINIEKCRHLLFVIPEDSLDISFMIIAAHYVGLGYRVILCIQYIDPVKSKPTSKLSPIAIKDYNRGRSYLSDMATKYHVPVFDNIDEAIQCCINLVHE